MKRYFNTEGPITTSEHYHIDPLSRIDWEDVQFLINNKKYFVLHAPRQTGKTTTLLAMINQLNQNGQYCAVYVNIEAAQAARNDFETGIKIICKTLVDQVNLQNIDSKLKQQLSQIVAQHLEQNISGATLTGILGQWAQQSEKPIVLMLDEVDALVGDTLISLLRQIRSGYPQRPHAFPHSIILCGVRDVKDYRMQSKGEVITGGSAFNIKAASLRMANFNQQETNNLIEQHTSETGQTFTSDVYQHIWQDTKGQPWLVNALGHQLTWQTKANRDRSKTIDLQDYLTVRETLIYSRATHLDQLSDKLKEPRVRSVIEPMLTGINQQQMNPDDVEYVVDLGLINRQNNGALSIANKIYQEVIPRELAYGCQMSIEHQQAWYITNNQLDMSKLLSAFQQFFRENADVWIEKFDYKEAAPHLILQAFLQRIVNGGARINREYALGRSKTDLTIEWPLTEQGFNGKVQRIVLELKILYGALDTTITKSLNQTAKYADAFNADEVHLLIFNRDKSSNWDDKIWFKNHNYEQRQISVWGC